MVKTLDVDIVSGVNVSLTKDWYEQAIKKFIESLNNREVSFEYKIYNDEDGTFLAIEDEDELEKIIEMESTTIEEINGRWTCTECGYEWSAMLGDCEIPDTCSCMEDDNNMECQDVSN